MHAGHVAEPKNWELGADDHVEEPVEALAVWAEEPINAGASESSHQVWMERQRGNAKALVLSKPAGLLMIARITLQPQTTLLGTVEFLSSRKWQLEQMYNTITTGNPESRIKVTMGDMDRGSPTG